MCDTVSKLIYTFTQQTVECVVHEKGTDVSPSKLPRSWNLTFQWQRKQFMNNQISIQYCICCCECYEKKMKQREGMERHKSHVWIRQPGKVIWRKQRPECRQGAVEMDIQRKCVSDRWTKQVKGNEGLWLRNWTLEFSWLSSNPGSVNYISLHEIIKVIVGIH